MLTLQNAAIMSWCRRRRVAATVCLLLLAVTAAVFLAGGSVLLTGATVTHVTYNHDNTIPMTHFYKPQAAAQRERMVSRRRVLAEACRGIPSPNATKNRSTANLARSLDLTHLLVSDRYQFIYCYVPKVACTSWKRVLHFLEHNATDAFSIGGSALHKHGLFNSLSSFSSKGIITRLQHYRKFIFVRDPMSRLVSAYRNKLSTSTAFNSYFYNHFRRLIHARYFSNGTKRLGGSSDSTTVEERVMSPNVTSSSGVGKLSAVSWRQFVSYLVEVNGEPSRNKPNEHWASYESLCHPCAVDYDWIGKHETLHDDARYILERLGVAHLVAFPKANGRAGRGGGGKSEPPREPVVKSPRLTENDLMRNLSADARRQLYDVYARDYHMFGYTPSSVFSTEF